MNTSERCLLRWTRLVSLWSLPARMKKSSCIQLTTPKLVNLNTLSMIHITLLQKPTLEEKIVMRSGTSAVDWWLGIIKRFSFLSKSKSAPLSATSYPANQGRQGLHINCSLSPRSPSVSRGQPQRVEPFSIMSAPYTFIIQLISLVEV